MQNLDIISWLQNCTFVCEECKMRRGCNYFSFVSRHVCLLCHFHESALGTVFYTSVKATLLSWVSCNRPEKQRLRVFTFSHKSVTWWMWGGLTWLDEFLLQLFWDLILLMSCAEHSQSMAAPVCRERRWQCGFAEPPPRSPRQRRPSPAPCQDQHALESSALKGQHGIPQRVSGKSNTLLSSYCCVYIQTCPLNTSVTPDNSTVQYHCLELHLYTWFFFLPVLKGKYLS